MSFEGNALIYEQVLSWVQSLNAFVWPLLQGRLYVMGGSNGHSDELSCGETYDPLADDWAQVPELRTNRCNAGGSTPMDQCICCSWFTTLCFY